MDIDRRTHLDVLRQALNDLELRGDTDVLVANRIDPTAAHTLMVRLLSVLGQQQLLLAAHQRGGRAHVDDLAHEERTPPAHWSDMYTLLATALSTHATILMYQHYMKPDANKAERHVCMGDTLFLVMIRALLCRTIMADEAEQDHLFATSAATIGYCLQNNICVVTGPVLSYSQHELNIALLGMSLQWPRLVYSADLVGYLQLMMTRAAMLASFAHTQDTHNVEKYRTRACLAGHDTSGDDDDDTASGTHDDIATDARATNAINNTGTLHTFYITSDTAARYQRAIFSGMLADVTAWKMFPCDEAASLMPTSGEMETVRRWLTDAPARLGLDDSSRFIRERFIDFSLQPGQVDVYRMENGNTTVPRRAVLTHYRGRAIQETMALASRTPIKMAAALAEQGPLDERANLLVQLLWTECIQVAVYQGGEKSRPTDVFVHTNDELLQRHDELAESQLPYIVRIFHHYQVLFRGVLYPTNSIVGAFALWLRLVRNETRYKVLCERVVAYAPVTTPSGATQAARRRTVLSSGTDQLSARHLAQLGIK